ncbi:putative invertase inhibitor [Musa acuminata AAA Group]|uniref:putative invertase inhibitor n=1 Tax=Musa acuminata AAA Group TaxID=214697 RepID=UPI0031DCCA2D
MAKPTALILTFLLFLLLVWAASSNFDATASCRYVTAPQLCTSVAISSAATSAKALTVAAVTEAASTAKQVSFAVDAILAHSVTDANQRATLEVCKRSYESAVGSLEKAVEKLQSGAGSHGDIIADISAALTDAGSCRDTFSQNPGMVSPVAEEASVLKKLVSNSLALASDLGVDTPAD